MSKVFSQARRTFCALSAALMLSGAAVAAEVPEGTVIDASNLDAMKANTFEGKAIGSMLPPVVEMQIRKYNMRMELARSKPVPLDPKFSAATEKNRGKVSYDAKARKVVGWEAGLPFPDVDPTDPEAGIKLMWNYFYGTPIGLNQDWPLFAYALVNAESGIERVQHWAFQRYYMKGRFSDKNGQISQGDGNVLFKSIIVAKYPFDLKGTGVFSIRYDNDGYEDSWVYLRSVRRTRKTSGGSWMDPIGATDQLNDDLEIFNAHPNWYRNYKVVGKRWVLAVANSKWPVWNENEKDYVKQFPGIDMSVKPTWNLANRYEPREVLVIEATPPEEHPYSKKIIYMEPKINRMYYCEAYDKKGELWKFMNFATRPMKGDDGSDTVATSIGSIVDMQRNHATVFMTGTQGHTNVDVGPDHISLGLLEKIGGN